LVWLGVKGNVLTCKANVKRATGQTGAGFTGCKGVTARKTAKNHNNNGKNNGGRGQKKSVLFFWHAVVRAQGTQTLQTSNKIYYLCIWKWKFTTD
tara:strand:+ start:562 stop:846 length:285 start_codon:yes stop_codon:yes gene_type:complete